MYKLKSEYIKLETSQRLYETNLPIVGLTGGIATGKSTVSKIFKDLDHTVIDADQIVHEIYEQQETKNFLSQTVSKVINNNKINFKLLRETFFSDPDIKTSIENYIYSQIPVHFTQKTISAKNAFIIYDCPLLFEKKIDQKVDLSICVYLDPKTQIQRLVKRDGISEELALKIINQQMPIEEKKKLCDLVIDNSESITKLEAKISTLHNKICDGL